MREERIRLQGTATAETELLLRARKRRDNIQETLPYLPGSTVRGHLATRWVRAGRAVDATFRELFLSGQVRFEHAYPLVDGRPGVPAPLTLRACKYDPFEDGHLTVDIVAATDNEALVGCIATAHDRPAPIRRVRGFVAVVHGHGVHLPEGDHLVSRQRIGTLGDGSGLAEKGSLFEERLVARGTSFHLEVRGAGRLVEPLITLLGEGAAILTVGRGRTVRGQVSWSWQAMPDPAPVPRPAEEWTLLLTSDTVFIDGFQRSITALGDPRVLAEYVLNCDPADIAVERASSRTVHVGGWDELHQLPKPADLGISAGSVVRFRAPAEAVAGLACRPGIGWRQSEGFGRFVLNAPVHRVGSWRSVRTSSAQPHPWQVDPRRDEIARAAVPLAAAFHRRGVTRSLWQGLEATVRAGRTPAEPKDRAPREAQGGSARGAGAGDRQREQRRKAVEDFLAGSERLRLTEVERRLFADDIGAELDLLRAQKRRAAR